MFTILNQKVEIKIVIVYNGNMEAIIMQDTGSLVKQIEKQIYRLHYDDLSDYLKGVRDFINLIQGYEDSESITEYILEQITNNK